MPTIEGIVLDPGLYWENFIGDSGVDGRMVRARDGTPLIWEQSVGGRQINLVGGTNTGTLTGAVLEQLQALASVPGGTCSMEYNGVNYTVRFRTWEQPVIEASRIAPREDMTGSDIYNNVLIKLMEA